MRKGLRETEDSTPFCLLLPNFIEHTMRLETRFEESQPNTECIRMIHNEPVPKWLLQYYREVGKSDKPWLVSRYVTLASERFQTDDPWMMFLIYDLSTYITTREKRVRDSMRTTDRVRDYFSKLCAKIEAEQDQKEEAKRLFLQQAFSRAELMTTVPPAYRAEAKLEPMLKMFRLRVETATFVAAGIQCHEHKLQSQRHENSVLTKEWRKRSTRVLVARWKKQKPKIRYALKYHRQQNENWRFRKQHFAECRTLRFTKQTKARMITIQGDSREVEAAHYLTRALKLFLSSPESSPNVSYDPP